MCVHSSKVWIYLHTTPVTSSPKHIVIQKLPFIKNKDQRNSDKLSDQIYVSSSSL